jgi:plasmid stabilization system protein ParE
MTLAVTKADEFKADFAKYFSWYVQEADEAIAWRFQAAMEVALNRVAQTPELGSFCRWRHPLLREIRAYRVEPPFQKILIFIASMEAPSRRGV